MITFRDREIVNEQLVLDSRTELYYLGPALTLRNCTLVVKIPAKALVVNQTRLIDCTIEVVRVLKNFKWDHAHLTGCRFKGRFVGNDFGNWRDAAKASVVDCDFSSAYLDGSRFVHCDVRTLRLPPWPCFTLFDTARRVAELSGLSWPGKKGHIIAKLFADDPPSTVAVTFAAPELAKFCGTTPEAIKAFIEKLDGVYY